MRASLLKRLRTTLVFPCLFFAVASGVFVACGGSDGSPLLSPDPNGTGTGDGGGNGDGSSSGGDTGNGGSDTGSGGSDSSLDGGADADASISCTAPMANCSGIPADGCNINTATDNNNCGGCKVVCNTGCKAGICNLIADGGPGGVNPSVGDFACIAVDATNVYLANGRNTPNGAVYRIPVNGGVVTNVATALTVPHGVVSDGTSVYFTTTVNTIGQIWKAPINGVGAPIVSNQDRPVDITTNGTALYWVNGNDGTVWTSDKNGANAIKIAGPFGQNHAQHIRANATRVFWTDGQFGVNSTLIGGTGAIDPIAAGLGARYLDIDSQRVFFSAGVTGAAAQTATVLVSPLTGTGAAGTSIATAQANSQGVATDGQHIYWATSGNVPGPTGQIFKADLDGKNAKPLASQQNFPACVAVDGTSVYWINENGGMISKTGK